MTIFLNPASPLPFKAEGKSIKCVDHGQWYTIARCNVEKYTEEGKRTNALYLARAANAYPDLVAALRFYAEQPRYGAELERAKSLLAKLGEAEQ